MISLRRTAPPSAPARRAQPADEWSQALLSRLCLLNSGARGLGAVGITSCARGEGVSTVAAKLAFAAAGQSPDTPVVLVDAHWSAPSVHRLLHADLSPGLADVLCGRCDLDAAIQPSPYEGLSLLTAGAADQNLFELAALLGRWEQTVERLRSQFVSLIFDLPPAASGSPAMSLARLLDGVVLVVEAERVSWQVARRTQEILAQSQVHLLGAAMNKRRNYVPEWLYRRL